MVKFVLPVELIGPLESPRASAEPHRLCTDRADGLVVEVLAPGDSGWHRIQPEGQVGILDKITGKAKQAAGDITDDPSLRRQGKREERKGEKKDELDHAQERADQKAEEVADLERKT